MALTYGFYNSIEGDRVYDAIQFGRIFDGIIKDGVYATYEKGMMVIASENPAEVIIQPGRAWFNHTWSYNDANVIFEAPAPEVLLERIDALVLEINEELSSRENSYKWVTGIPSSRPERPTLTNTSTIHQYPLCYVHRYPETTMIYTRDITNMVGTSECPFATGVLEGIDLDAWINQWDDEFHTWENSKKTQFEAWMLSQETAFTTWYNAFKDQMAADVQEVEDFVDYLESVLDASTAVHLQEEIDDLRNEISSGSYITVTTINSELYGRNVTITEAGGTVFTEKFDNTGVAVFKSVPYVGNLTISSTYGTQTAERVVNTPYYARYEFAIAFWAATVNIVGDPEMSGSTVTVKDSNETVVGTVVLDSEGTGVYTAIKPDTYKFTLTYGGETMEVTLSVTQETTYTVDLHAASDFDYEDWLEAGGVTGSYASLDDVLADEVALRRLFTVHASVDYMAGINDENEDVQKIINCNLAAKWINLRDYALDTLYANAIIAGYMDEADKYFYGEWCLISQVPKMTSNTTPSGEAFARNRSVGGEPYFVFDGNINEDYRWWDEGNTFGNSTYIGYGFENATSINEARVYFSVGVTSVCKLQGTNDKSSESNWVDLSDSKTIQGGEWASIKCNSNTAYKYFRIYIISQTQTTSKSYAGQVLEIQFCIWGPKGNVPIMTANNAPYGEVTSSDIYSSTFAAYKAFNGTNNDSNDCWISAQNSIAGAYLCYTSPNPICIKAIKLVNRNSELAAAIKNFKLQGSNDGTTWTDIATLQNPNNAQSQSVVLSVANNDNYYLKHRILVVDAHTEHSSDYVAIGELQFYGRELSVSVPTMTSNTTPYGEAYVSTQVSGYPAWKAFDNGTSTNGGYINQIGGYIGFDFKKDVCIKGVYTYRSSDNMGGVTFDIEAGDSTFTKIGDRTGANGYTALTSNTTAANKIQLKQTNKPLDWDGTTFTTIQFYGLDYSEKEFETGATKKWLYDHGLELVDFGSPIVTGSATAEKQANQFYGKVVTGGRNSFAFAPTDAVDLTDYDLLMARAGDRFTVGNSAFTPFQIGVKAARTYSYSDATMLGIVQKGLPLTDLVLGLDISSINQSAYPMYADSTSGGDRSGTIKEIWLE